MRTSFTDAGIERVKRANPIEQLVGERVALRRKGKLLVATCVFHREKTPSLTIYPDEARFHCFGCGADGDVIAFLMQAEKLTFPETVKRLCTRASIPLPEVLGGAPQQPPRRASKPSSSAPPASAGNDAAAALPAGFALTAVVDHYHRTLCETKLAQDYLARRGFTDFDILRALKVGYADGSLLRAVPRAGELREALRSLGVITDKDRELLGGCIVVPIPDPVSGAWVNLYGRGVKVDRHCYLPRPMGGVPNFQAARAAGEVVLAESILDALSFLQAGITTTLPLFGTNGFTADLFDLLKRERVKGVILALDNDEPGRKATAALKEKLTAAGIAVRVATLPDGIKDPNELLVSRNGDAGEAFRKLVDEAEPRPAAAPVPAAAEPEPPPASAPAPAAPAPAVAASADAPSSTAAGITREDGQLVLRREGLGYHARVYPLALGRLRATVRLDKGQAFHVDTIDLYASRSRAEFAKRAHKLTGESPDAIEADLLALVVEAEKKTDEEPPEGSAAPAVMSAPDRDEALGFLRRPDLLDAVAREIEALGYVGEPVVTRLLYLVAISRKLADPLSAIVLSPSGAGKSGATEVIERVTPPEDVVLITRLTPQSLYYTPPGFLDRKLVIVEERYGSMEADYSIRVLQSRKKLIAAAPVKDPSTGNMRTKVFTVEARAAFIEATTASSVNHENATRCFELSMDESVEQTRRIHERQRLSKTKAGLELRARAEAICRRHWNAQRLLEPLPVVIPFAHLIHFPDAWMRTRRDHARFLNLIEVSAFLHQYQREREDAAVVASVADYAVAYALAGEVLAETLTDVRRPLREAHSRIQALCREGDGTVSRREIREALGEPDSTVRRWLADLVELEYLAQVEQSRGGAGRSVRYRLVERDEIRKERPLGLLTPEELVAKLGREG